MPDDNRSEHGDAGAHPIFVMTIGLIIILAVAIAVVVFVRAACDAAHGYMQQ